MAENIEEGIGYVQTNDSTLNDGTGKPEQAGYIKFIELKTKVSEDLFWFFFL